MKNAQSNFLALFYFSNQRGHLANPLTFSLKNNAETRKKLFLFFVNQWGLLANPLMFAPKTKISKVTWYNRTRRGQSRPCVLGKGEQMSLTQYQLDVLKKLLDEKGMTWFHELDDARQFCQHYKLSDKTHAIIQDLRRGRFFLEPHESMSMIRPFEKEHKIAA